MTDPGIPLQRPRVELPPGTHFPARVQIGYRCRPCKMTSHNPADAKNRYCGNCHEYYTGDVIVTSRDDPWLPGTHPIIRFPDIGCDLTAHGAIGWCFHCRDQHGKHPILPVAEVLAWRLHVGRHAVPGYAGAILFSRRTSR